MRQAAHTVRFRTAATSGLLAAVALACACSRTGGDSSAPAGALTEDMSWGRVELTLTIEPREVDYARDVLMTIRAACPSEVSVTVPPVEDRLSGFAVAGQYDEPPAVKNGSRSLVRRIRLTPLVAAEHRIAPMAIQWEDRGSSPPDRGWFPTRPIVLQTAPMPEGGRVEFGLKPRWIPPGFASVAAWIAGLLAAAALVFGIVLLARRLHREQVLRRMSPRERALHELADLLARDLVAHDRTKDFFLELTMIVRRYIERQHGIRAPEQTTEEFLAAVRDDPRFTPEVTRRLREFLQAADLVKFAARRPERGAPERAAETARQYVATDSGTAELKAAEGKEE
ncbi:MAG: hypothetical protein FJ224_08280 [Lentisphaerae bacterium]|nr:hypothetical protein [Lentisphaerota bacterium]